MVSLAVSAQGWDEILFSALNLAGTSATIVNPELALALFVAPVLVDAAFDASPRDLRTSWRQVASLGAGAVALDGLRDDGRAPRARDPARAHPHPVVGGVEGWLRIRLT